MTELSPLIPYVEPGYRLFVGETINAIIDALPNTPFVLSYTTLRQRETLTSLQVIITSPGIAGLFVYDPDDDTTPDNGGTVIVDEAGHRWKRRYDGPASVQWWGTDAAAFQALFTAIGPQGATRAAAHFPAATYAIGSEIVLPTGARGGVVQGDGNFIGELAALPDAASQTVLIWSGANGGTLLSGAGVSGLSIRDMMLAGRPTSGTVNRAGVLLAFEPSPDVSTASGVSVLENLAFVDGVVGLKFGTLAADNNCADILGNFLTFNRCDVGIRINNLQGLNYNFPSLHANFCPVMIQAVQGGNIFVTDGQFAGCGGTGANDWVFDLQSLQNNGSQARITGLRVEQSTKQVLRARGVGAVTITEYEEGQSNQSVTMVESHGCRIVVQDSRLVTHDATHPHFRLYLGDGGQVPDLHLERVHFDVATFNLNEWVWRDPNGQFPFSLVDCTYGALRNPIKLANIHSHPQRGTVAHVATTTDATPTYATLDGLAHGPSNICFMPPDSTAVVDIQIVAQKSDGSVAASFVRRGTFTNTGGFNGTTTQIGSTQTIGTDENAPGWAVLVESAGTWCGWQAKVTGHAATTVNWGVSFRAAIANTP